MRRLSLTVSIAAFAAAVCFVAGMAVAADDVTPSEIPKNAYPDDPMTQNERAGIASEEDVSPNDGSASVPAPQDQAVIPDAADPEKGDKTVAAPADGALPGDTASKGASSESEATKIIDQSKDNFRVTQNEYNKCLGQWDPQTQMSKDQWAQSCRTTLQYFPEGNSE